MNNEVIFKQNSEADKIQITSFQILGSPPVLALVVEGMKKKNFKCGIPFDSPVVSGTIMTREQVENMTFALINWLEVTQDG